MPARERHPADRITRRRFVASLGSATAAALAGCGSRGRDEPSSRPTNETSPGNGSAGERASNGSDGRNRSEDDEPPVDDAFSTVDERVTTPPPGDPPLDPSGAWPARRYDARNSGCNLDGTGLRTMEPYWRLAAGGPASVADGTLYNVASDAFAPRDDDLQELTLRDPSTAAVEHRSDIVEYQVNSPPVVAGGRVFLTTYDRPFCFDARSGERRWSGPELDPVHAPPVVRDGRVFVNSNDFEGGSLDFRAFAADTGEQLWQYERGHESYSGPAVGDRLAVVCSEDGLHAVDAETGQEASFVGTNPLQGPPVLASGLALVRTDASPPELEAIDVEAGEVRWRRRAREDGPPVASPDVAYAATAEEGLAELDLHSGAATTVYGDPATPVGRVGDVLYARTRGTVLAYDVESGEQLWSLETERVTVADTGGRRVYHVTPVDGAVYVSARDAFYGLGPA